MLDILHFTFILIGIGFFALLSRKFEASIISMPMVFTGVGWALGQGGAALVPMNAEHEFVHVLAEVTLILVLFSDASEVNLSSLRENFAIPTRMLLIGMPLTIALGAVVAQFASPEAPIMVAVLVAAILTPTDAALGQAVVSSPKVPTRISQGINVESGLNDGLALPVVMIAAMAASMGQAHDAEVGSSLALFAIGQVVLGPLSGLFVGFVAAKLLDLAISNRLATIAYQGIFFLTTAFLCFATAELVGGNGLIAAFVGGLTFGNALSCSKEFIVEFMEGEGKLLTMATFLIFGAAMLPAGLEHANIKTLVVAVAFLTVVRMAPIWVSLIGAGVSAYEKLFLGWFGPRGLASVLFALLVLEEFSVPGAEEILACVVLTVLLSIILHGVSANPLANVFGDRASQKD